MQIDPLVSIIIPCCNEKNYISVCLESIISNDYPKNCLEVLVMDGFSDDGTRDIIESYVKQYPYIQLLDNHKKITPTALNLGIRNARGEVIILMGAHSTYEHSYVSKCVKALKDHAVDVVGGVIITHPFNTTPKAKAIATGLSHPFGIGNSYFRIGVSQPKYVDTVPFGCYKKDLFDRIGYFDEDLVRNQDDEFNLRLIKSGGRILLVPEIISHYYARDTFFKLWRMYYQYGYFKPLVALKLGKIMTIRQLVPALFLFTLSLFALFAPWSGFMRFMLILIILSYALMDAGISLILARRNGIRCGAMLLLVFPIIHFSYGLGFLKGVFDFILIRRKGFKGITSNLISR